MRIREILDKEGVWYRIIDLETPGRSSREFARQLDDNTAIVKTIIMKVGDEFKAFFVPADHLVDYRKLRNHFKTKKLRMAREEEVLEHSTCVPGACCPLLVDCPIYFDPDVLKLEKIDMGSGDVMKGLEMKTKDLIRIVEPEILDVSVHKNEI